MYRRVERRFGRDIDRLWERVAPRLDLAVRRDAAYLNWKYIEPPHVRYSIVALKRDETVGGYAVYRHVQEPRGRVTLLVDFLTEPDDTLGLLTLLRWVDREARAADSDRSGRPRAMTVAAKSIVRERLPTWYGDRGYIDFQVTKDTLLTDDDAGKGVLSLTVDEGKAYQVGTFEVVGNRRFSLEQVAGDNFPFATHDKANSGQVIGVPFNRSAWASATEAVRSESRQRNREQHQRAHDDPR